MEHVAKVETADVEKAVEAWFKARMKFLGREVRVTKVELTEDANGPRGGPVIAKVTYTD